MKTVKEDTDQAEAPEFNPSDVGYVSNLCAHSEFLLRKTRDLMAEVIGSNDLKRS